MPKDQGEACSLLSFCDSSHGWPDHLVVSTSLPCPGATSASPYKLNRLHTLSLESGAALQTSELYKVQETSCWLLPPPRTRGDRLWSQPSGRWWWQRPEGSLEEGGTYWPPNLATSLLRTPCFLRFPACLLLSPVCTIPQIKSWGFFFRWI